MPPTLPPWYLVDQDEDRDSVTMPLRQFEELIDDLRGLAFLLEEPAKPGAARPDEG